MKQAAILFDLDGTLIDSGADLAAAVNAMRASFGLPPLETRVVEGFTGDGILQLIRRSIRDGGVDEQEAVGRMRQHYLANLAVRTKVYPGVLAGLQKLREAGWTKLGVVTNKPHDAALEVLEKLGLRRFFSAVAGGGEVPLKPAPDGCLALLRQFGATPGESIMLGDHYTDLAAAKGAGMRAVYAGWGMGEIRGEPYEYRAADFTDFVDYVERTTIETEKG